MAKLTSYNNKTKEMRDKTEKLTKSGYNHFVSCMMGHEEMVAEKTALKKNKHTQPKKAPKAPEFVNTFSENSENEEDELVIKIVPKFLENSGDSDSKDLEPVFRKEIPLKNVNIIRCRQANKWGN